MEQALVSETFAFSASEVLGLNDLQDVFIDMWAALNEFDDLLDSEPVDEARLQTLINRFGKNVYKIESRLAGLEKEAG